MKGQEYYRRLEGRWSGALHIRITDWNAWWSSKLSVSDRFSVALLTFLTRFFGPIRMETSVAPALPGEWEGVIHRTTLSWRGLPILWSTEPITLEKSGDSGSMTVDWQYFQWAWKTKSSRPGPVVVHEDGSGVDYVIDWLGEEMRQTARSSQDALTVTLVQETCFFRGTVALEKIDSIATRQKPWIFARN